MAWTEKIKSGYKIAAGTWVDPKKGWVTFAEYFEQVWFPNRDAVVERYTQRASWSSYTEHIKPFFGHRELRAIS